jgi:hypothetical protein
MYILTSGGLHKYSESSFMFKKFIENIIQDWDFENICTAHYGLIKGDGKKLLVKTLRCIYMRCMYIHIKVCVFVCICVYICTYIYLYICTAHYGLIKGDGKKLLVKTLRCICICIYATILHPYIHRYDYLHIQI